MTVPEVWKDSSVRLRQTQTLSQQFLEELEYKRSCSRRMEEKKKNTTHTLNFSQIGLQISTVV